jgi:hypothetical protein
MYIKMQLAGIQRDVLKQNVKHYESFGWERVVDKPKDFKTLEADFIKAVDSGVILVKPPKKKSTKTAEQAPEAAQEDLGNDINKGE